MHGIWEQCETQMMIYRVLSQACRRRRLETSPVLTSILRMGANVSWWQINRGTPAWNWLPKCHICHIANQKVISQDTGGECDFVLFWLEVKTHMQIFIHLFTRASFSVYCSRKHLPCLHAGFSSNVLLIQWVACIHTQELCSTISLSSFGYWAAAVEQVVGKCFSKPHSNNVVFREIINI